MMRSVLCLCLVLGCLATGCGGKELCVEICEDLKPRLTELIGQLGQVMDTDVASFNSMVVSKNVPPIVIAK